MVLTTVLVFATGVLLLAVGPRNRGPWLSVHKVGFFVWLAFTALHVLGHLPRVGGLLGIGGDAEVRRLSTGEGVAGRWIAVIGALVVGVILAVVLLPRVRDLDGPRRDRRHHHHG